MDNPEIRLVGGDLDELPPYAFPIVLALGMALLNWSRLEQQIDVLLVSINKEDHSQNRYRPTLNTSFRLKCELFERWFAKDPRFAEHHTKAKRLCKAFRSANDDRTLLIHSNVQKFVPGPPAQMIVRNLKIEGDNLRVSRAEWTEEQLSAYARSINGLNRGLYSITEKVLKPDFLESLQKE